MAILSFSGKISSGKDTSGQIAQILLNAPQLSTEGVMTFLKKGIDTKRSDYYPGWGIKKFADKLKDMVCMLLGCTREQLEDQTFKETELGEGWWYYKIPLVGGKFELVDYLENNKSNEWLNIANPRYLIKTTPRLLLQLVGTECGRQILHPNIWVNALMSEYKGKQSIRGYGTEIIGPDKSLDNLEYSFTYPNWIITDTRFPNELKAVKDRGGITIRVNRPCNICGGSGYHKMSCPVSKSGEHCSETALDKSKFDYTIENDSDIQSLVEKIKEILIKEKLL